MFTLEKVEKFLDYLNSQFDKEEIDNAMKESEFDKTRIQKENIEKLSNEEIKILYGDLAYMALYEFANGDFETMYDVLKDCMDLDEEDIGYLLDF